MSFLKMSKISHGRVTAALTFLLHYWLPELYVETDGQKDTRVNLISCLKGSTLIKDNTYSGTYPCVVFGMTKWCSLLDLLCKEYIEMSLWGWFVTQQSFGSQEKNRLIKWKKNKLPSRKADSSAWLFVLITPWFQECSLTALVQVQIIQLSFG